MAALSPVIISLASGALFVTAAAAACSSLVLLDYRLQFAFSLSFVGASKVARSSSSSSGRRQERRLPNLLVL